jgi:hypothetical protein
MLHLRVLPHSFGMAMQIRRSSLSFIFLYAQQVLHLYRHFSIVFRGLAINQVLCISRLVQCDPYYLSPRVAFLFEWIAQHIILSSPILGPDVPHMLLAVVTNSNLALAFLAFSRL